MKEKEADEGSEEAQGSNHFPLSIRLFLKDFFPFSSFLFFLVFLFLSLMMT